MTVLQETFKLANGTMMPKIGFGTWQIPDGEATYAAVSFALAHGYRHIDTAHAYGNEASVGRAVRDSGIERSEIFVTSKLPAEVKTHDEALATFDLSMTALGLDYVDLYLIHAPWPWNEMGADYRSGNKAVWAAFEQIYAAERAKAVGVSNFNVDDLRSILDGCVVKPMVDQIKFFIGNTERDVVDFCRDENILVEGYSPLATGKILSNGQVRELAARYGRSVSQICIRYVIQQGIVPLPKSTHGERILENGDVDFEISRGDMTYLDSLRDTVLGTHGRK